MTTESDPQAAVRAELKRRRHNVLGLTAAEAGRRAGITGQWWTNLEAGYQLKGGGIHLPANITRKRLIKMAAAVELEIFSEGHALVIVCHHAPPHATTPD